MLQETAEIYHPETLPLATHHIDVGDGHVLYVEERGARGKPPIILFHGGPGGEISGKNYRLLDPEQWHIIQFDQRGCGKSTPRGGLEANTTQHLITDIEVLRQHFGFEAWHLAGGSWGSTLALAYALDYPRCVKSLSLWGVFLGTQAEIEGTYTPSGLPARIFPDRYANFLAPLSPEEQKTPLKSYIDRIKNTKLSLDFAKSYARWEFGILDMHIPDEMLDGDIEDEAAFVQNIKLQIHYFEHGCFLRETLLLSRIQSGALNNIPCHIVHGRYDLICPVETAWQVHNAMPKSTLQIIPFGGHWGKDGATVLALKTHFAKLAQSAK